ncbi:porin [Ehrlichia canis]|uniref:Uncharacterized protein n=1 Tax=Ehrlichia canis (strain Jake) TaxID=269484 RepID=A0ACA6AVU5_EHRCJ|nr:porin [Ehrlichia canis]AAZ68485.1 conserved hypothetical protein [Ehrlichia canis str. Jake]AUO54767.1 porin [Ehrlichia canis]UKC53232.1 porin [Ehrlichia canis]UKC54169.1 porin [Ehrlichia canis]UKC55105.1 porin [Ehrlichia canis]
MCNKILYMSAISCFALLMNQAMADNLSVNGSLKLQYGINSKDFSRMSISANPNLTYSYDINDYVTIGSHVKLGTNLITNGANDATGSLNKNILDINSSTSSAYIFLKSPYGGNIQIGLTDPVAQSMKTSSIGSNGNFSQYISLKNDSRFPYGYNLDDTILVEPSIYSAYYGFSVPVISYYSPKIKGLEIGCSYIFKDKNGDVGYRNIFDIGVKYENNLFSDINYSISGTIEHAVKALSSDNVKFNDLLAYSTGISVKYKNFTFAGSYGNLGKSGKEEITISNTSGSNDTKKFKVISSHFYDLGIKFETNIFNVSANYFYSSKKNSIDNKEDNHSLSVYTLGLEKVLDDKLSFYADIIYFTVDRPTLSNNSGYLTLIGAKLSF